MRRDRRWRRRTSRVCRRRRGRPSRRRRRGRGRAKGGGLGIWRGRFGIVFGLRLVVGLRRTFLICRNAGCKEEWRESSCGGSWGEYVFVNCVESPQGWKLNNYFLSFGVRRSAPNDAVGPRAPQPHSTAEHRLGRSHPSWNHWGHRVSAVRCPENNSSMY